MPSAFFLSIKTLLTALVVVGVSEIAKRSSFWGAILASLPLTSLLAMVWLYAETQSQERVVQLSYGIFWAVLPSFLFFLSLPLFLRWGVRFVFALPLACGVMAAGYAAYTLVLRRFGVLL